MVEKTMTQEALELFSAGKDIKETHRELRRRHGRCSRRTVELAFKRWEKENITPGQAKPAPSASAKPTSATSLPSDIGGPKATSELTTEAQAKDPDDLFIESPPEPEPQPATTEQAGASAPQQQISQPAQQGQAMPEIESMVNGLQGLTVEELRELVKTMYMYFHEMPAKALGVPASEEELKQFRILGKMIGLRYINDLSHVDAVFWGSILMCELAFWGSRVPSAMEKLKAVKKKLDDKGIVPSAPAGVHT